MSGTGDNVIRVAPQIDGLVTAEITHTGSSNFAVFAYGGGVFGADLLVNEIGNYSGESLIGSVPFLMEITADGAWSITPS